MSPTQENPPDGYKRWYDLTMVAVLGVVFLPLWLLAWVVIPLALLAANGRPVLFKQERLGKGGRPFMLLKFRTMVKDAEAETGPVWEVKDCDPRLVRFGRFLRRTSLDEMPQLVNILRGEMSIVGPRPERREFMDGLESEAPGYGSTLDVLPGIAGLTHVRRGVSRTCARNRLRYERVYMANMSPWLDTALIFQSVWIIAVRTISRCRRHETKEASSFDVHAVADSAFWRRS